MALFKLLSSGSLSAPSCSGHDQAFLTEPWGGLAKPEDEELLAQRLAENWLSELPCIHALLGASGGTWEQSRNH